MEKVNTMSLRDVNRYQFRKIVPQAWISAKSWCKINRLNQKRNSTIQSGLSAKGKMSVPKGDENYWIGPKKPTSKLNDLTPVIVDYNEANSIRSERKFVTGPKPILIPKPYA